MKPPITPATRYAPCEREGEQSEAQRDYLRNLARTVPDVIPYGQNVTLAGIASAFDLTLADAETLVSFALGRTLAKKWRQKYPDDPYYYRIR